MTYTGSDALLVIHAGSATIKFLLCGIDSAAGMPALRYRGLMEQTGAHGRFLVADVDGGSIVDQTIAPDDQVGTAPARLLQTALEWLESHVSGVH